MKKFNVIVTQACDGFYITVEYGQCNEEQWYFSQEGNIEELVDVFEYLGYSSTFEEAY